MSEARKLAGGLREITRLFAVQLLYAADILQKPVLEVLKNEYLNRKVVLSEEISLDEIDIPFLNQLIDAYSSHADLVEETVLRHLSKSWTMDRLNKVLTAILRLGTTELLYLDTPANVTFNEYIEIAKAYFPKADVAFVNGLLNSVHKNK